MKSAAGGAGVSTGVHVRPSQCSASATFDEPLLDQPTAQQSGADAQAVPKTSAPRWVRGAGVSTTVQSPEAPAGPEAAPAPRPKAAGRHVDSAPVAQSPMPARFGWLGKRGTSASGSGRSDEAEAGAGAASASATAATSSLELTCGGAPRP